MVRRFIIPSTIQIKKNKKNLVAAHDGKEHIPPWDTALAQRHADAWR
jgi:hypothetical protein